MVDVERYLAQAAGNRLPPERELAKMWGVSRGGVRKVLARLELEGRLIRKVGSGTYVRSGPANGLPDVSTLCRITSPRHAMEARLAVEPESARLAAINATAEQIEIMRDTVQRIRGAQSWAAYKEVDKQLHQQIAQASGNKLLEHLQNIVEQVRASVVWDELDTSSPVPPADYTSFAEHEAIIEAIARHDRDMAAEAMRRHLRTTYDRLVG